MEFQPHLFCRHDLFTFKKFCACVDNTFLVPNESRDKLWRDSEKYWSEVLHEEGFICILICGFISLIFISISVALTILGLYNYLMILKILCPYLGASDFGRTSVFRK